MKIKKAIEEVKRQKQISEELNKILNKMKGSNSTNSNMPFSMDILFHSVPKEKKVIVTEADRQVSVFIVQTWMNLQMKSEPCTSRKLLLEQKLLKKKQV